MPWAASTSPAGEHHFSTHHCPSRFLKKLLIILHDRLLYIPNAEIG
jgi:hypothetical protein